MFTEVFHLTKSFFGYFFVVVLRKPLYGGGEVIFTVQDSFEVAYPSNMQNACHISTCRVRTHCI